MKKMLFLLTTFVSFLTALSQNKVVANISNFENNNGVARACLFNSASSFSGEGGTPFKCVQVSIKNKFAQAVFENVPDGTYALFVFHDENVNNRMDKNFLGIPSEGYGASKNKLPFASAPTFNSNRFVIQNSSIITLPIKLRNL